MPRFDRVLVPVDFSELTDTVLRYGVELTKEGGTTIVLHVLEPLPLHFETAFGAFVNTEGLMRIRENALRMLEETKQRYPDRTFITELREGKAAPLILDAAQRHRAQLIVMGTHGRGGLEHLFLGSVAARIVRNASCPVLTVRNAEPGGA
ncbi:MAG TPA: universal stress protein [Planctomycetota bacterium]|nr:universal stress protein [Planctomycetota bacterium]